MHILKMNPKPPAIVLGLMTLALAGLALAVVPRAARAQGQSEANPAALDTTVEAGEADAQKPVKRGLAKYNEFDSRISTLRIGYGFLVDFATYVQDDAAKKQVVAEPDLGLRDFRLLFKGKFKTERPFTWTMGVMWDGPTESWHFRQTGIMVAVPELSGYFFVGRTKEGYSQYKVMTGYDLWTMERSPFLDAFVPILGDGIKWLGASPKRRLLWNIGWFTDKLSEKESFSTYDNQFVARVAWLPVFSEGNGKLLHLAVMGRDLKPDDGNLRPRSRPEAFLAPYFVDTGKFPADHARTAGLEAYYRTGSWLYGAEYGWQTVSAPAAGDPLFHGGNITADWLITGETRGYNSVSGYFNAISPKRTVFEGGPGAWEVSLNLSYVDLDGGTLRGGKFWRVSPAVKWHLMDYLRVELGYGYGVLDRYDLRGTTQFFQGRILTAL